MQCALEVSKFSVEAITVILVNLSRLEDLEVQKFLYLYFFILPPPFFGGGWKVHRENFDSPMPFPCFHNLVPAWVHFHFYGSYSSKLFSKQEL